MNKKVVLAFVLGVLISGVSVYAATNYLASEIVYNDTTVENALNELYTVHETYKNLTSDTTVTPDALLNGITAYNKNGELVTGNISTNCVHGTRTLLASEASKDIKLADFTPTFFIVSGTADNRTYNWIYDKNIDATHRYKYIYDKSTGITVDTARQNDIFDTAFKNPNNTFVINFSNAFTNSTISYTICK